MKQNFLQALQNFFAMRTVLYMFFFVASWPVVLELAEGVHECDAARRS